MKTLDEMWGIFLDGHKHLSIDLLEDIKSYSEMAYAMGELAGLQKNVSRETNLIGSKI